MKKAMLTVAVALLMCGCATKKARHFQADELTAEVGVRSSYALTDSLLRLRSMELDSVSVVIERDSAGERITLRARRAVVKDSTSRQTRAAACRADTLTRTEHHREATATRTARRLSPWLWLALAAALVTVALRSLKSLKSVK